MVINFAIVCLSAINSVSITHTRTCNHRRRLCGGSPGTRPPIIEKRPRFHQLSPFPQYVGLLNNSFGRSTPVRVIGLVINVSGDGVVILIVLLIAFVVLYCC